jgi:hypothetical protein
MRCDEVTRELASPSDSRDDRALAQHLEQCKRCAEWADRASKLDRLWGMTRPVDPGAEAWASAWTSVNAALDSAGSRTTLRPLQARQTVQISGASDTSAPRAGRFWRGLAAVGTIALAQAAAVLLAIGFAWNWPGKPNVSTGELAQARAPETDSEIDVEDGQVPYIRSEGQSLAVLDVAAPELPNGEDPWYVFFGRIESARTQIAMTE